MNLRKQKMTGVKRFCALLLPVLLVISDFNQLWAQTASMPRIGIGNLWSVESDAKDKLEILNNLTDSLKTQSRFKIVRDNEVKVRLEELVGEDTKESGELTKAGRLLKKGRKYYLELQLQKAKTILEEAKRLFILNLHRLNSNIDMLNSHLYLGLVYIALKKNKLGINEFRKVVYLDPHLELSTKQYAPEILKAFEEAKQEIISTNKTGIFVESVPTPAQLHINGRLFGNTPAKLMLPEGEYFFRLSKKGHQDWFQLIKVTGNYKKIRRTLVETLQQENNADLYQPVSKEDPATVNFVEALTKRAVELQVDLLLLGALSGGKTSRLRLQWFDARTQEFSSNLNIRSGNGVNGLSRRLPVLVRNLLRQISASGYVVAEKAFGLTPRVQPVSQPTPKTSPYLPGSGSPITATSLMKKKKPKPWYKRWWFWILTTGLAAGATTAVVFSSGDSKDILVDNGGNIP